MKWHGDEFERKITTELGSRLVRGAIHLQNAIKKKLGIKSTSLPGEPPGLVTGELRRSITYEVDEKRLIARVGTNKVYGRYLDKGTNKMDAREFLDVTLQEEKDAIARILVGKKIQ